MSSHFKIIVCTFIALIGSAILLSLALGWKLGIGITLLAYFHKQTEQ